MNKLLLLSLLNTTQGIDHSLREAAKGSGIEIGAAINYKVLKTDAAYGELAAEQYSLLTSENACKMNQIAKSFTENDFTGCKYIVDYAQKNNMKMRAHNLIWGAPGTHNPSFVQNEKDATVLEKYMTDYITETVKAIGDYPLAWDVVNEAISNSPK